MTRTTITADSENTCTVTEWNKWSDDMQTTDYWAPQGGGYVWEGPSWRREQVLTVGGGGVTLVWEPRYHGPLIDLIRRERQRWLAERRRDERRWPSVMTSVMRPR